MTVALFGTSADPPTEGHRVLLEGLLQRYPLVATWASDNPLKQHGAPLALRSELLGTLVAAIHNPRLSLEPELSSPWAIETLERAGRRWPGQPLVFVVGSDLVAQIPRWRQAARLLQGCRLAIAPRGGWPLQSVELASLQQLGARTEILDVAVPATASSRVRQQAPAAPQAAAAPEAPAAPQAAAASPAEPPAAPPAEPVPAALQEVPPALWPLLLQHNLYGLQGPSPP